MCFLLTDLRCNHLSSSVLVIPAELVYRVAGALVVAQEVEVLGVLRRSVEPCRGPEELILVDFFFYNRSVSGIVTAVLFLQRETVQSFDVVT